MALKNPIMPMASPTGGGLVSAFSPYSDSPNSPARFSAFSGGNTHSNRSSAPTDSLAPPPSPYPQQIEPSPVDSNGTEGTEIDEDAQEDEDIDIRSPESAANGDAFEVHSPDIDINSPASPKDPPPKIVTSLPARLRSDSADNDPQSVIHIPTGFKDFEGGRQQYASPTDVSGPTARVASPSTPEAATMIPTQKKQPSPVAPVNTDVPRSNEKPTPRAQTRQELDDEWKRKSRRTSSLEDIPEGLADEHVAAEADDEKRPSTAGLVGDGSMQEAMQQLDQANEEIEALRTALSECWTLCNTLANLSSSHRQRTFKFRGQQEVQQHAWQSCWRLCQQLYDNKDEDHTAQVIPTLELCRDFCQSLFDARARVDEATDSVLRVSFELNNHLYNINHHELPDAFVERTLDFYITLCHRLMKMPTSLPRETDSLLRACWSLAEMLFNLRQSSREGKQADEELLGSAVQACWDLCDLFREGWTQIRPDRGTPRPHQTSFGAQSQTSLKSTSTRGSAGRSTSSTVSNRKYHEAPTFPPETPVTVFDDTSTAHSSPDSANVPNILVLGPSSSSGSRGGGNAPHHDRWTSNASVLSDYSESAASATSSQRTSSTATAGGEETHLARLRCLLLKAGLNTGYSRTSSQPLPAYVQALPDTAFGILPWQMKVLSFYKKLVVNDQSLKNAHAMSSKRVTAVEVAKSVRWLGNSEQWAWMRDLFRIVFGFGMDEADLRGGWFVT
ncbi:hypothetical protein CKM354_000613100 [Cercospora kikuchii]|uniref:DUF7624 domain-containing protein n=1 Tax=Cercospora kikuchii TaxID=84275 RepID=A0A9P3CR18_9PEZI|nr:uncharacterized protein CKM354_000613100 [Cercospora kikuchii]GIZ42883.1 hypothetical protein CKM354_000613100 [Cercospora kikuchii]